VLSKDEKLSELFKIQSFAPVLHSAYGCDTSDEPMASMVETRVSWRWSVDCVSGRKSQRGRVRN